MNSGVAGKSSSSIITSEVELGGRFFLSPLLIQHSQNKRVFLNFPIFKSEGELQDSSLSTTVFPFFFCNTQIYDRFNFSIPSSPVFGIKI